MRFEIIAAGKALFFRLALSLVKMQPAKRASDRDEEEEEESNHSACNERTSDEVRVPVKRLRIVFNDARWRERLYALRPFPECLPQYVVLGYLAQSVVSAYDAADQMSKVFSLTDTRLYVAKPYMVQQPYAFEIFLPQFEDDFFPDGPKGRETYLKNTKGKGTEPGLHERIVAYLEGIVESESESARMAADLLDDLERRSQFLKDFERDNLHHIYALWYDVKGVGPQKFVERLFIHLATGSDAENSLGILVSSVHVMKLCSLLAAEGAYGLERSTGDLELCNVIEDLFLAMEEQTRTGRASRNFHVSASRTAHTTALGAIVANFYGVPCARRYTHML